LLPPLALAKRFAIVDRPSQQDFSRLHESAGRRGKIRQQSFLATLYQNTAEQL
jgi:hypothetical protein